MTVIGQYSPKHMFSALYGDPELERDLHLDHVK